MATGARLLLMRHCKSSWKEYNEANYFHQQSLVLSGNDYNKMNNDVHVTSMSDAMRSLNKRGRRDAVRVGRELAKRGLIGVGMGIGKSASSHSTLSMKVKNGQESGIVTEEVEWQEEDGETRNTENNESRVTLPAICSVDTTIPVFTSHAVRCRETLHRMMVGASQSKESISSCNDSEDGKIGSWKADDGWWPRSNMIHVEQDLYAASEKVDSIVDVLKKPVQAAFEKNLHHSSKNDRVQWSRSALHTSTVMLLGHNPGMELLARSLGEMIR